MAFLKSLFAPVDMTEGAPWKKIVAFAVPMLIGNIAQQLYNTVDSIVVGYTIHHRYRRNNNLPSDCENMYLSQNSFRQN